MKDKKVKLNVVKVKLFKDEARFSLTSLLIFALSFVAIGAVILLLKSLAAAPQVAKVEAENMTLPAGSVVINDTAVSGGKAVRLTVSGSQLGSNVNLPSDAASISVVAKGVKCRGVLPTVEVSVDGSVVLSQKVTTIWQTYSANKSLPSGDHGLLIKYLTGRSGCKDYLYVDQSTFFGADVTPPPVPTVSISASPSAINAGESSTLSWSSTNASSCTASEAWSGSKALSGTANTGALSVTSNYSLSCTGAGGTASSSTTVTVNANSPAPTTSPTSYVMRGIYDLKRTGIAAQPGLGFSETWATPYTSDLDGVYAKILPNGSHMKAWMWVGNYNGTYKCAFSRDDTWIRQVLTSAVVNHPANNHRYTIADDTGTSPTNGCTNMLTDIKNRAALIKSLDPKAITHVTEYRTSYMARWKGVVDELWLDGYPNASWGYQENVIPDQAKAAEATGMPYLAVVGVSNDACPAQNAKMPTATILHHEFDQWRATKMIGYTVFAWRYPDADCSPSVWLENHPELTDQLKLENGV